mmetsp:Transcript_7062/g.19993  ORF Transcript_7062/g.19993 Transcript_7062/m.19993 type:complete len:284 (-) Transcript_7062:189-1040(-)
MQRGVRGLCQQLPQHPGRVAQGGVRAVEVVEAAERRCRDRRGLSARAEPAAEGLEVESPRAVRDRGAPHPVDDLGVQVWLEGGEHALQVLVQHHVRARAAEAAVHLLERLLSTAHRTPNPTDHALHLGQAQGAVRCRAAPDCAGVHRGLQDHDDLLEQRLVPVGAAYGAVEELPELREARAQGQLRETGDELVAGQEGLAHCHPGAEERMRRLAQRLQVSSRLPHQPRELRLAAAEAAQGRHAGAQALAVRVGGVPLPRRAAQHAAVDRAPAPHQLLREQPQA